MGQETRDVNGLKGLRRLVGIFLCASLMGHFSSLPAFSEEAARERRRSTQNTQVASSIIGYQPLPNQSARQMSARQAPVPLSDRGQNPGPYNYMTWLIGEGPYTLGRDDVITIQVRNQPEFSGEFLVGPEGKIQYNYAGDVEVLGLTKEEVQEKVEELLGEFIRVPEVNVSIVGYNSKAIYVIGEVARPGRYIMRGDTIKLREAIIAAGLPNRSASLGKVRIITPDVKEPKVRKVNLKKILYSGELLDDIDLYPGEVVVIPATILATIGRGFGQLFGPARDAKSVTTW